VDLRTLAVAGDVITRSHPDYETARRVWNGAIDRHPAAIIRCTSTADVVAGLAWGREQGLTIAVRGGGHSIPGLSTCDDGVVLDLGGLRRMEVDAGARMAVAGPGLVWADFDAATQEHGLASPGGEISDTGIAGLTLGGGIGWVSRRFGLACDQLVEAEVVTADGRIVRASADEHADLFWGLRGGGGNFGVVTEFRFRVHPVGPVLPVAIGMHPAAAAGEALRAVRDWCADQPDEVGVNLALITAPPVPPIPPELHGQRVAVIAACHTGDVESGGAHLRSLERAGLAQLTPMPYVALQSMVDAAVPPGRGSYVKSEFLGHVDDAIIDALLDGWAAMSSPLNQILLRLMGGAIAQVDRDATAFVHRDAGWMLTAAAVWPDPAADPQPHAAWSRAVWEATLPASSGGGYVNHLYDEGEDRVRAAYGPTTWDRLVDLKTTWDPDNVFRLNQNIRPRTAQPA